MDEPLPSPLWKTAVDLFNQGEYVLSFELLEQVWHVAGDRERDFYKGFIQTSGGLAKLQQGNARGAESLLSTGLALLEQYEPVMFGIDVTALIDDAAEILEAIRAAGPAGLEDVARRPMPRVRYL